MPLVPAAGYDTGPAAPRPISPDVPRGLGPRQEIEVRPEDFGAQVGLSMSALNGVLAKSAEEFAGVALARADLHNKVSADNQINAYQDQLTQKESAFFSLHGKDAADAYPAFRDDLIKSRNDMRNQLQNQYQRLDFDNESRRLQAISLGRAGAHYDHEYDAFQSGVNKAGETLADQAMAANINNDEQFNAAVKRKMEWKYQELQRLGRASIENEVWAMQGEVRSDAVKTQVEGRLAINDFAGARRWLDQNPGIINPPQLAAELNTRVQAGLKRGQARDIANQLLGTGGGGIFKAPAGPHPFNMPVEGATADEQPMLNEIRFRESGGNYTLPPNEKGASGAWQFTPDTWKDATKATGLGTEFDAAYKAPNKVQDANALWLYRNRGIAPWAPSSGPYPQPGGGGGATTAGLDPAFKGSLDTMIAAAAKDGVTLKFGSGRRSYEEQAALYKDYQEHGGSPVAAPGTSMHEKGLADDLRDASNRKIQAGSPEDKWLAANQDKYGIIRPVKGEAWHVQPASTARTQVAAAAPTTVTDVPPGAPGGTAAATPTAGAGGAARAVPIPTTTAAPAAPQQFPGRPDYEGAEARVNALNLDEDTYRSVVGEIQRQKHDWDLTHASEQRQLRGDVNNTIAQLAAGKDVPLIPEARIKAYAPNPDFADDWIQKQQDAQELGAVIRSVRTMTYEEAATRQAELDAAAAVPGIHDYVLRSREAEEFRKETIRVQAPMRQALREDVNNTIAQLGAGKDVPLIPEDRIRQLVPDPTTAEDLIAKQKDASHISETIRSASTMSLDDAQKKQAELDAEAAAPGIHDYAFRQNRANAFREAVFKAHATDRKGLTNTIDQLAAGVDVPLVPEDRIRQLIPNEEAANALIQQQQDAAASGGAIRQAKQLTMPEAGAKQAQLVAAEQEPGITDFAQRHRAAANFAKAATSVRENMSKDPAAYLASTDPTIIADQTALRGLKPEDPAYPAALAKMANDSLAAQEHYGLPDSYWHVLSEQEAKGMTYGLMTHPDQAPSQFRAMAQQWGTHWPMVWSDMVNLGGLPLAYQAVGVIPNAGSTVGGMPVAGPAETLARALAEPDKGGERWKELLGEKVTGQGNESVWYRIKNNYPAVTDLLSSMGAGHAAKGDEAEMIHAIKTLTYGNMVYNHMDIDTATKAAVDAFTSQYEYPLAGGGRIPKPRVNDVVANVAAHVEAASEDNLTIPPSYRATADKSRPDLPPASDYLALEKAHPLWINNTTGDGIVWIDHGGRPMLDRNGNQITVRFDQPAPPGARPTPAAPALVPAAQGF